MKDERENGFTLVEMVVVAAITVTMLAAVWNAATAVNSTVHSNARSADVGATVRGTMRQVGGFVRPAKMTTIIVQAVEADVLAVPPRATVVGEWIQPTDLVWRPGIEFESASGLLSMNAALSTAPRRLTFHLEPGELDNGIDDDGDELIDEGEIRLMHDTVTIAVVRNVEECLFQLEGRMLRVRLQCGRSDQRGTVFRVVLEQSFYLRNN